MTQLIINGAEYPESSHDKYKCYENDLGESMRMISGRLVTEVRAKVTVIEYSYDHFKDELMRKCLTDLRSGDEMNVQYLDPADNTMKSASFRCTKWPAPTFAFSSGGRPLWHNVSFTLEEVDGHA